MPYSLEIVADQQLIVATACGTIGHADIEAYLDRAFVGGQLAFAKLIDNRRCDLELSDGETELLAARIRAYHGHGVKLGPVAMVVKPSDRFNARLFQTLADADRPVRIFFEIEPARRWLDSARTAP